MISRLILLLTACGGIGLLSAEEQAVQKEAEPGAGGHVFAWPFMDWKKMAPRGGSTKGSEVELQKGDRPEWLALQEGAMSRLERDRRAILAMAGDFRVSFDFVELMGMAKDYTPPRPYFSWGTEHVKVLEDTGDLIRLQHALVMFFKGEDGEVSGPHVMKHWRQDWRYEDPETLSYVGENRWVKLATRMPEGRWTQAVYQVDDSPRYEAVGSWKHDGGLSFWRSDDVARPLPRREFSVRDDYQILDGSHEITITPSGWIHQQNNRKMTDGNDPSVIGTELGVNRYEAIVKPALADAFEKEWEKTGAYWKAVRVEWEEIEAGIKIGDEGFALKNEVDDKKLFQLHFEKAAEISKGKTEAAEDAAFARETVRSFLIEDHE